MIGKESTVAEDIIKRLDELRGKRGNWESHWEEIAQRVLPNYSTLFDGRGFVIGGEKRTQEVFDSTAAIALSRFSSAMESMLTPRQGTWHNLRPTNNDLMKDRATRLWFEDLNRLLFKYRYAPKANFSAQIHETYVSLGAFGSGVMFVDDLQTNRGADGLRYKSIFLGEVYFCENHQGIVDTAYRIFTMSARQMIQMFGDKVPKEVAESAEKNIDKPYEVIHCVRPNTDKIDGRADFKGMEFYSAYVMRDGKAMLREGGYNTFPYCISRYVTTPGETYGRSPAMMVLPAIKTLNEEKKTILKQGHRIVDPVLLAYDDGVIDSFSLKNGAINYGGVSAEGRPLVHPLPTGNLSVGQEMMNDERAIINDAFLVTLFQILIDTPQMTATEVMERSREKGALLSPTMGRQQSELLGPMIEREIDLLMRQRKLPPMPSALREADGEYRIEYDSPLSRQQKAEEGAGTMRTMQWAAEIAAVSQNPAVFDHFNFDEIIPELADINAMPSRFINPPEVIQALRDGRRQQQATQQLIDAAPSMAAMMKQGVGASFGGD